MFRGSPYKGPPIGVPPPHHFQTPANDHISFHAHSQGFSFIFWLYHTLFGQDPRAGSGKTAAAQNDIKARFSAKDGLYILKIVFCSVDNSLSTICLKKR